jgi:hypothetical protein
MLRHSKHKCWPIRQSKNKKDVILVTRKQRAETYPPYFECLSMTSSIIYFLLDLFHQPSAHQHGMNIRVVATEGFEHIAIVFGITFR